MKARTLIVVLALSLATLSWAQSTPSQAPATDPQAGTSGTPDTGTQTPARTEQSTGTEKMQHGSEGGCPCMSGVMGHGGHGMMRGSGEMRKHADAMKANVEKLRAAVKRMPAGAARDAEAAELAMWEQLAAHMQEMAEHGMMGDPHHGGMGMGKGADPHHGMQGGHHGATSGSKGGAQKGTTPKTETSESAKPTSPK